jgi:DNA-directed RNA polymerase specialized sigma24 family protein
MANGKTNGNNFYIKNVDLLGEIIEFKKNGRASETLGKMLLSIAKNFSSRGNFSGYTWRNDMVSEAVLTCLKYLKNFNPERSSNAFSYITQICNNSFKAYIKIQNKHSKIKDICFHMMENGALDHTDHYMIAIDYEGIRVLEDDCDKLDKKFIKICEEEPLKKENKE